MRKTTFEKFKYFMSTLIVLTIPTITLASTAPRGYYFCPYGEELNNPVATTASFGVVGYKLALLRQPQSLFDYALKSNPSYTPSFVLYSISASKDTIACNYSTKVTAPPYPTQTVTVTFKASNLDPNLFTNPTSPSPTNTCAVGGNLITPAQQVSRTVFYMTCPSIPNQ